MPPQRLAVSSPDQPDLPTRQRFVGVPPALAVLNEATRAERCSEPRRQLTGELPLPAAVGRHRPLQSQRFVTGDEGRFATHGQFQAGRAQPPVHLGPQPVQSGALIRRVGLIGATVVGEPVHGVAEIEVDLAGPGGPGDRRRLQRAGRCGQRDVPLAGQQGRGRIETDPAGSRHVRLRPGVQIGRVALTAVFTRLLIRSFTRLFTRIITELHQVARDEPGRETEVPQRDDQQPRRVPARADPGTECLLRSLDAGFHPRGVPDRLVGGRVQRDQEIDGGPWLELESGQPTGDHRVEVRSPGRAKIRGQVTRQRVSIAKRERRRVVLDEEVEGIDRRHLGHQTDGDLQRGRRVREDHPGHEVPVRILLPAEKVISRADGQRVGGDRRPAVRGGAEPDEMRSELGGAVETVARPVVQRDRDAHESPPDRPLPCRPRTLSRPSWVTRRDDLDRGVSTLSRWETYATPGGTRILSGGTQ